MPPAIKDFTQSLFGRIKLDTNGCWIWQGSKCVAGGYGVVRRHNITRRVHRVIWEFYYGPVPKGKFLCHRCDNPPCCNPEHLFVGTNQDNMTDSKNKNRMPRGTDRYNAKLNEQKIIAIRSDPRSQTEIGREYNINSSHVSMIKARKRWAWV